MANYTGGPGDDQHISTNPSDTLDGGGGFDTLTLDFSAVPLELDPEDGSLVITEGADGHFSVEYPDATGTGEPGQISNFESLIYDGYVGNDSASFGGSLAELEFNGGQFDDGGPFFDGGPGNLGNSLSINWSDLTGAAAGTITGSDGSLNAEDDGRSASWTSAQILSLITGAGDDHISVTNPSDGSLGQISLAGGAGDDVLSIDTARATVMELMGGDGNDTLSVTSPTLTNGYHTEVFGGAGDDLITIHVPGVDLIVSGGDGVDTMVLDRPSSDVGLSQGGSIADRILPIPGTDFSILGIEIIQFTDRTVDFRTNAAPTITSGDSFAVGENDTSIGTVAATDPEGDDFVFFLADGADRDAFTIDDNTGQLSFVAGHDLAHPQDGDGDNVYEVRVVAVDKWNNRSFQDLAVAILPGPGPSTVNISDAQVSENDGFAHLTVTRTGGTSAFTVDYATTDGSAVAGTDYGAKSGTLSFADGQNSADIAIPIINDGTPELSESFSVNLVSASGADIGASRAIVTIRDDDPVILGTNGADALHGTSAIDLIRGLGGDDTASGGDGADLIYGGAGADSLWGEGGEDEIHGNLGEDKLFGGAGRDLLYGEQDNDTLEGGDGEDSLYGQDGNDVLYGGADADTLGGSIGDDLLYGQDGNDQLAGDYGNDQLYGGDGNDDVTGSAGADQLHGEAGDDGLYGGGGADHLDGAAGNDHLNGGDGNDFLDGGDGADYLDGGGGADSFYFGSPTASGVDTIRGFASGVDKIAVSAAAFGLTPGTLDASAFEVASVATGPDAEFFYNSRIHILYWDDDGAGGDAGVAIAFLQGKGVAPLASDFIVV